MNPNLRIDAQQHKGESTVSDSLLYHAVIRAVCYYLISSFIVSPDTETTVHTDEFFCRQDLIVNALDNVEARIYVDQRCVDNARPLLESGTTGAKGHTQVVVPHITESYGSQVKIIKLSCGSMISLITHRLVTWRLASLHPQHICSQSSLTFLHFIYFKERGVCLWYSDSDIL